MTTDTLEIQPPARGSVPHLRGRILIVDDEPVLRAMVSTILISQGWEVMSASNAEEAAELLKYCSWNQKKVDVVILDLIMPGGMSGMEALTMLRGIQPDLRFVASSGFFVGEDSRKSCLGLGFDDTLPKPYNASALAEIIERNVGLSAISAAADVSASMRPADLQAA